MATSAPTFHLTRVRSDAGDARGVEASAGEAGTAALCDVAGFATVAETGVTAEATLEMARFTGVDTAEEVAPVLAREDVLVEGTTALLCS